MVEARAAERRVLGDYSQGRDGPLLVFTGGVHGNEPAGVEALQRVFAELERTAPPLRGRAVALAGNLAALARKARFVDQDLNRMWTAERFQRGLELAPAPESCELSEQRELIAHFRSLLDGDRTGATLIDLHSTSGLGPPFAILTARPARRRLAQALGVPAVYGLQESVPGTLIDWFEKLGHAALVVEGGQNDDPRTRERHVAVIWLALEHCGLLEPGAVDLEPHRRLLAEATADLPSELEVALRWGIEPGEGFRMEPGFLNLQRVRRGELLAHTGRWGEVPIHAPFDGLLVMPLYQAQGSDGFFLGLSRESWPATASRRA